MISFLSGKLIELGNGRCSVLISSGIGYEVLLSENTLYKLNLGENVELFIYHNINENSQSLFGFLTKEEKELFLELTKVSGVGGKSALNILDLGHFQVFNAVSSEDTNFLSQAKGIGKKMAEKIIVELKDKDFIKLKSLNLDTQFKETQVKIDGNIYKEIKLSLVTMGYNQYKIEEMLKDLPEGLSDIGDIIPYVIKNIK